MSRHCVEVHNTAGNTDSHQKKGHPWRGDNEPPFEMGGSDWVEIVGRWHVWEPLTNCCCCLNWIRNAGRQPPRTIVQIGQFDQEVHYYAGVMSEIWSRGPNQMDRFCKSGAVPDGRHTHPEYREYIIHNPSASLLIRNCSRVRALQTRNTL